MAEEIGVNDLAVGQTDTEIGRAYCRGREQSHEKLPVHRRSLL